jgi:hypothetical protein
MYSLARVVDIPSGLMYYSINNDKYNSGEVCDEE